MRTSTLENGWMDGWLTVLRIFQTSRLLIYFRCECPVNCGPCSNVLHFVVKLCRIADHSGLLATVPHNHNSGTNDNVGGVNPGTSQGPEGSSEDASIQKGTSQAGRVVAPLTVSLLHNFFTRLKISTLCIIKTENHRFLSFFRGEDPKKLVGFFWPLDPKAGQQTHTCNVPQRAYVTKHKLTAAHATPANLRSAAKHVAKLLLKH